VFRQDARRFGALGALAAASILTIPDVAETLEALEIHRSHLTLLLPESPAPVDSCVIKGNGVRFEFRLTRRRTAAAA